MGRFVNQGYQSKYNGGDNPIFEMSERELLRTIIFELCNLSDKLDKVNNSIKSLDDNTDKITCIPNDPDHYQNIHNVINVLNRIEKKIDQLDNE